MNPENTKRKGDDFDWGLCTFEGARREQLRRWAHMPLDRLILALEEMEAIAATLHPRLDSCAPSGHTHRRATGHHRDAPRQSYSGRLDITDSAGRP